MNYGIDNLQNETQEDENVLEYDNEDIEEIKKGKFPLIRLAPNIITILSICFGLTSLKMALAANWEFAVICIIISCFLDGIDGKIDRFLGVSSSFGAHLDSLADFVNFGIAPSLLAYLWNIHTLPSSQLAWAVTLFYSVCCAIRLARFNVSIDEFNVKPWKKMFFIGFSSTISALYAIVPIMIYLEFDYALSPIYYAIYMVIISILMPSRIPTFSGKKISIDHKIASLMLVALGFIVGLLIMKPWLVLPILLSFYLMTIPFSVYLYLKKDRESDHQD